MVRWCDSEINQCSRKVAKNRKVRREKMRNEERESIRLERKCRERTRIGKDAQFGRLYQLNIRYYIPNSLSSDLFPSFGGVRGGFRLSLFFLSYPRFSYR
jgi:hypothetical protein